LVRPRARGLRLAVLADGGGHGAIAASLAASAGLELPELGHKAVSALEGQLPDTASCSNPIDLAGGAEQDIRTFHRAADVLLHSSDVDALLMTGYFGGYAEYGEVFGDAEVAVGEALARAAAQAGRTLVVQTMYPSTPGAEALRRGGVATYRSIEQAIGVLARLAVRSEGPRAPIPELPQPARPVADHDYTDLRGLLSSSGIEFAGQRTVDSHQQAREAAADLGYPVALKALGVIHKSDAGGVALDLRDDSALVEAMRDMEARLSVAEFSVEQMAPTADGVELLIGSRWDERFGPVALVGLGGIYTEVLRDLAVGLAPVSEEDGLSMLEQLRAWPLLAGTRGRPALDVGAAATALARLSGVASAHPELAELEINPLLVLPSGALALDARAIPAASAATVEAATR
jgi:acyl-CoA synthetase (NDP forming)